MELDSGKIGEHTAEIYLKLRGWRIVDKNFSCRFGELDIVAAKDGITAFVEVKTRARGALVSGEESVDYHKQKRLRAAAMLYLQRHTDDTQPRFDVCVVEYEHRDYKVINYIENAF